MIVAVNKMDTVAWSQLAFQRVVDQIETLSRELGFTSTLAIPVSALLGDNVATSSANTPWYDGPSVLDALEAVRSRLLGDRPRGATSHPVGAAPAGRRPNVRRHGERRGLSRRRHASRCSRRTSRPRFAPSISEGTPRLEATVGLAADLDLADETDAGRGDLIATQPLPAVTKEFEATICWFGEKPCTANGQRLRLKHTTKSTPVRVQSITGVIDIESLAIDEAIRSRRTRSVSRHSSTGDALVVDDYSEDRVTGSFVLIDEVTNATVAAGMVGHAQFL